MSVPAQLDMVIVQLPATADPCRPPTLSLRSGSEVTFGRDPGADVVLADQRVPRLAGRIRAMSDYWLVSNLTCDHTYIVENPESSGEFIKLVPRRLDMPVPFEFARVVIRPGAQPPTAGLAEFLVFAPQHSYLDTDASTRTGGDPTVAAFSLDESAKYFLVLVALCEPRLRDPSSLVLPNAAEVRARLAGVEHCVGMSAAAINTQIDYLARTKLRVRPSARGVSKADWQREELVRLALRFDVVREEHLALLR